MSYHYERIGMTSIHVQNPNAPYDIHAQFPRGVHSLLYFAYTCVRDLFMGGGYLPCKKAYKVMVFYM
jgi:hypothetical protein